MWVRCLNSELEENMMIEARTPGGNRNERGGDVVLDTPLGRG